MIQKTFYHYFYSLLDSSNKNQRNMTQTKLSRVLQLLDIMHDILSVSIFHIPTMDWLKSIYSYITIDIKMKFRFHDVPVKWLLENVLWPRNCSQYCFAKMTSFCNSVWLIGMHLFTQQKRKQCICIFMKRNSIRNCYFRWIMYENWCKYQLL